MTTLDTLRANVAAAPQDRIARLVLADCLDEQGQYREAALVRVLAEPERDEHRLAFADACEREGDTARAEFVRVQVELAKYGSPHKTTSYPREDVSLRALGEKCYEFCGYTDDGFKVGDRIDLLVQRFKKKPKMVYGFRVYKIVPYDEPYATREVSVYVRLDSESGKWKGAELKVREDDLLCADVAHPNGLQSQWEEWLGLDRVQAPSGASWFRRGFVESVTCTSTDWLAHADSILAQHPVRSVRLTDMPLLQGEEDDVGLHDDPQQQRFAWQDVRRHSDAKGYEIEVGGVIPQCVLELRWPHLQIELPTPF